MKKLLLFAAMISAAFTASARSWAPAGDNIMTPWAEDVDPARMAVINNSVIDE